jgi:predicted aconitase with swiveling domain
MGKRNISGEAIVTKNPITLLGFVDPKTGEITEAEHDLNGQSITDKIFVFPRGVGSTVGPYTLINLMKNGKGPLAIINRESDQGTVAGCSVARIPLAYGFEQDPTKFISSGDKVTIKFESGTSKVQIE